jgi:hypothetical protein
MFENPVIPDQYKAKTGGDGTFFTVFVTKIVDDDTVEFSPALDFPVALNTRYAVMSNGDDEIANLTVTTVTDDILETNWTYGLGGGVGMGIKINEMLSDGNVSSMSTEGSTTRLVLDTALPTRMSRFATITIAGATDVTLNTTHTVMDGVAGGTEVVINGTYGTLGSATYEINIPNVYTIIASDATSRRLLTFKPPQTAIKLTFDSTGYVTARANDIGMPVRQTVGGVT